MSSGGPATGRGAARPELCFRHLIIGAVEVRAPRAQQVPDDGQGLGEAVEAMVGGEADTAAVLGEAGPQPENQPAAADLVDRIGQLGHERRIAQQ